MALFDDDSEAPDAATLRGQGWPSLRQFCVFLENRVGRLHDLLRHVERYDLRVLGLSVVDSADFAVTRLIVNDTDRARELFARSRFTVIEGDVLGVCLPDSAQPFLDVFTALLTAEINIHYAYPILYRRQDRGALALHVDNLDQAAVVLQSKKFSLVTEDDLLSDG
ncbi:MAG: acetolactate synthase [Planctomyces sp.]|nr:acetolactate synthase [Planctomyces sp.]